MRFLLLAVLAGLIAHALHTSLGVGGSGLDSFFNNWVYNAVFLSAAAACLLRAVLVTTERAPWLAIGLGLLSWGIGDVYWTAELSNRESIPYPSLADAFYLLEYPALYVGIMLLVRKRVPRSHASLWLDGAIAALTVAALASALLYPVIRGATNGDAATVATNLAYPLGDLLLLSFVIGTLALTGWRPGRGWMLIAAGLSASAVADGTYLYQEATSGYVEGTGFDSLWLVAPFLLALAAWDRKPSGAVVRLEGARVLAIPSAFGLAAVGLQIYDQVDPVSDLAIGFAGAALLTVILRMVITFGEYLHLLSQTQHEALTDPLTGLGNRRRLLVDMDAAMEGEGETQRVFALFDLDGFKSYNDSFGHSAGDALLARMGHSLAVAVEHHGRAYRLGGDEFCVLASSDGKRKDAVVVAAAAALTDRGEAFEIGSSYGVVRLPIEAGTPSEALRIADRRMYANKSRRPHSAERQTRNVLMRVLREREPKLGEHLDGVASMASDLARAVGITGEELDLIARAAELHDVGKMAIPDEILHKPGPLNEVEERMMSNHTLIGERILAAAPAMAPVARLVRASHEWFDGSGDPDGLRGEEIPLGARIISICDAFEAMTAERSYRYPVSRPEAVAELRRCAGTQFDPHLVEVFCGLVEQAKVGFTESNRHAAGSAG